MPVATETATAQPSSIPIGSRVVLKNLVSAAQYNGKGGYVKSEMDPASLRQTVAVIGLKKKTLSIKTANLQEEPTYIVEAYNCARFLHAVNGILGSTGGDASFSPSDLDFKVDTISSKEGYIDNEMFTGDIDEVVGIPIGRKGAAVTMKHIIAAITKAEASALEAKGSNEYYPYFVALLKIVSKMVGMKGPVYFEHGIAAHSNMDNGLDGFRAQNREQRLVEPGQVGFEKVVLNGDLLRLQIGEEGRIVSLEDIIDVFRMISVHQDLEKFRHCGRSYFLEGFEVSNDHKTLIMQWGS